MITPAHKDKVLLYLCTNVPPETEVGEDTTKVLSELELEFDIFNAIMIQFQRFGFIANLNLRRSYVSFRLLTEAHDYIYQGGFVIQEEIFLANFQKLELEIDNLKRQLSPDKLDTLNKLSGITSALFSGLALLPK